MNDLISNMADIAIEAARINGVTVSRSQLFSDSRIRPIPMLRFLMMNELIEMRWTTAVIGRIFNRNHSSISHAKRVIHNMVGNSTYGFENQLYKDFKRLMGDGQETRG